MDIWKKDEKSNGFLLDLKVKNMRVESWNLFNSNPFLVSVTQSLLFCCCCRWVNLSCQAFRLHKNVLHTSKSLFPVVSLKQKYNLLYRIDSRRAKRKKRAAEETTANSFQLFKVHWTREILIEKETLTSCSRLWLSRTYMKQNLSVL